MEPRAHSRKKKLEIFKPSCQERGWYHCTVPPLDFPDLDLSTTSPYTPWPEFCKVQITPILFSLSCDLAGTACYHLTGIWTLILVSYLPYLLMVMLSIGIRRPFLSPAMFSSTSILQRGSISQTPLQRGFWVWFRFCQQLALAWGLEGRHEAEGTGKQITTDGSDCGSQTPGFRIW